MTTLRAISRTRHASSPVAAITVWCTSGGEGRTIVASIRRRGDTGRWRARYRAPDGREHSKDFARKVDAERWAAGQTVVLSRGDWTDPQRARVTVGDWSAAWMRAQAPALKPKTRAGYESLLRTRVLPAWRDVPLAGVGHGAVAGWVAGLAADVSASRTRQAYHLLTGLLDAAVRDGRLSKNPARAVDLPRLPRREIRPLRHHQLAALAGAAGPYRPLILLLAYTGLRWGEAAGLRVRRVDFLRRRIEVAEAVADVNGRLVYGPPKTHQRRAVAVPTLLVDELAPLLAGRSPDDLMFTTGGGAPLRLPNSAGRCSIRRRGRPGSTG